MSQNFSLALANPVVTTGPASVVYVGAAGGNTLDLTIANNFGFDVQLGGSSLGKFLVVKIAANVLDAAAASALTVKGPWSVASHQPPATGVPASQQFWTFNLQPPATGVSLPNGRTTTIELQNLQPAAGGNGLVLTQYQFDETAADNLNASATLSMLAPPDPNAPRLIGDDGALRLTLFVNGGDAGNPIMVSGTPVTSQSAVANGVQFNLLFQNVAARAATGVLTSGDNALVPSWDPLHPPSIRIFFRYFSAFDSLPAPLDLTDALTPADAGYNPLTSAWRILASLDPRDPQITSDAYWHIALDPVATTPTWLVTPTSGNTHLFTSVQSSFSEPGPFLNLFLSSIVSALPIDAMNPDTIVSVQWNHFPGFNDGIATYPLQKTTLAINSFSGRMQRTGQGPELLLDWATTGADHCLLSGETARQGTAAGYKKPLTPDAPLLSAYTLTAVGPGGHTKVSRTLTIQWALNSAIPPVQIGSPDAIAVTPDGKTVVMVCGQPSAVMLFDPETLQPRPMNPIKPPDAEVREFTISPDSRTIFVTASDYQIYGFDLITYAQTPPDTSTYLPPNGTFYYHVTMSANGATIVVVTMETADGQGTNAMTLLNTALDRLPQSPVWLERFTVQLLCGPQTGRYFLSRDTDILVLDPVTYQPAGSPIPVPFAALLATGPDEANIYAMFLVDPSNSEQFALGKIGATTLKMDVQIPFDLFDFPLAPVNAMTVSPDGQTLFVVGPSYSMFVEKKLISRLMAYDAATLEQRSWSPISFGTRLPLNLVISPDGSRLYVIAADNPSDPNLPTYLHAVDPQFS